MPSHHRFPWLRFLARTHPRPAASNKNSIDIVGDQVHLFVYGTLRKLVNHPLHHLLTRHATFVGTGSFQGKLYDLGRYPGAVRSPEKLDCVIGEIYRIHNPQTVFEVLDEHEGRRFQREQVTIDLASGQRVTCWIYLYARSTAGRALILSGDYIRYRNNS